MRNAIAGLVCVAGLWCGVAAGQPASSSPPQMWLGNVTGTDVYVRATADPAGYPCMKLSRPAQVTVVAQEGDRYKILPPVGAFSVISKDYVKLEPGGQRGTVTGENVHVRAGTAVLGWTRIKDHYAVQGKLRKGDRVRVVGSGETYYKIVPPKGAYFYIAAQFVQPASAAPAPAAPLAPTTRPAPGAPETATTQSATGRREIVADEPEMDDLKAAIARFEAIETRLKAEYEKPVAERDLRKLLADYESLEVDGKGYLQPYVDARVGFLERAIAQMDELQKMAELLRETRERQRELDLQRMKIEMAATTRPAPAYAAAGILLPSAVFYGAPGAPKRYVVRDPDTLRITAYAQCTTDAVNLADAGGKEVGLLGSTTYDRQLGADIIEVRQVVVLREQLPVPAPPQPVVRPYVPPPPPPAPVPAPQPAVQPAPVIQPTPAPIIEPAPAQPPVTVEPEPQPVPEPAPVVEPTPPQPPVVVQPAPEPAPTPTPALAPEPAPAPEPEPLPVRPIMEPLPPTGLPVVVPSTQPTTEPVNEEEYD